ncbi:MAG: ABC-2 transporter permease [Clostridium sp.]|nr:ABC-2 transporter permease [Clostridium sp.]
MLSGIFSLIAAVQYPISFKFGYNKAKLLALLPLLALFFVIIQLPALAERFGGQFSWEALSDLVSSPLLPCLSLAMGLVLLVASCSVSCGIYARRDR